MGTGKINVWITEIGKPCKISHMDWAVAIAECDGKVLKWCGKEYLFTAKHGHVEIPEVPPGTYIVTAARWIITTYPYIYFNRATNFTVVNVNCGKEACVILYTPTYPECGYLLKLATEMIVEATQERAQENPASSEDFAGRARVLIDAIEKVLALKPIAEIGIPEYLDRLMEYAREIQ